MFIEVHLIQSFAPSNLNRDDANNPKDCEFGGVRRARISSQCIKRAIRTCPEFARATEVEPATRTKWVVQYLAGLLQELGHAAEEATAILQDFVPRYFSKLDSKVPEKTAVLIYLGATEAHHIAEALHEARPDLKEEKNLDGLAKQLVKRHKGRTSAPDVALFGRMLAEHPELNLEASCQVAHAISTHPVAMEMDFFTAVDDLNPEDTAGAGMMGFTGFNSACFYRYSRIDWQQLLDNLHGDHQLAAKTVKGFLGATLEAVPSGKQSAFAAHNAPSLALAVVRENGMCWSLANAFEKPVRAKREGGLVAPSVTALDAYWQSLCSAYGTQAIRRTAALVVEDELEMPALQPFVLPDRDAWVGAVLEELA